MPLAHFFPNFSFIFFKKIVNMTKNTPFFSNFECFCTPKQYTHIQRLVLKNNTNCVNFFKENDIPNFKYKCPSRVQSRICKNGARCLIGKKNGWNIPRNRVNQPFCFPVDSRLSSYTIPYVCGNLGHFVTYLFPFIVSQSLTRWNA